MRVEAVKLPFLAAESCWFGFCLVKLHPKLPTQLMKSSEIFGSARREESQLPTLGAHLSLLTREEVYFNFGGQASPALPPRAGYCQAVQTVWGMICPAPSREHHLTEQAVGVWYL